MFEWSFPDWTWAVWPGIIVIFLFSSAMIFDLDFGSPRPRACVVWFGFVVVAVNAIVAVVSGNVHWTESSEPARAQAVTAKMGLVSGQTYPLQMGSRLGGSAVKADAHGGIFSARASVNVKPASVVSLGFTAGEKSYIFELPVASVTFIQSDTKKPSVRMVLSGGWVNGANHVTTRTLSSRDCHFRNLIFVCPRKVLSTKRELQLDKNVVNRGLSPIVSENLYSATITLTPQMYKEVLGLP